MSKSNPSETSRKLRKPHPDFPMYVHRSDRWAKRIRGQIRYFGRASADPRGDKALALWLEQKDDLLAGREPRPKTGGLTVADCLNKFLESREIAVQTGELTPVYFEALRATAKRTVQVLGRNRLLSDLSPDDFRQLKAAIVKSRKSLTTLSIEIVRTKIPFNWAFKNGMIDRPVLFGTDFAPPPRNKIRIERNKKRGSDWTFTPEQVRALLDAAGPHLRAMILLAIQCGFGRNDCATLPLSAVDLASGWINFPRPKTGIARRVPLWTETIDALNASLAKRPTPKTDESRDLFFVTKYGASWGNASGRSAITLEFFRLCKRLGITRHGRGLYGLRHTFRTAAGKSRDVEAIRVVMGHTSDHVEEFYLHGVDDDRLRAVVNVVHDWLFAVPA